MYVRKIEEASAIFVEIPAVFICIHTLKTSRKVAYFVICRSPPKASTSFMLARSFLSFRKQREKREIDQFPLFCVAGTDRGKERETTLSVLKSATMAVSIRSPHWNLL